MDRLKNKKVFVRIYSREILEKCKELGFKFEFEHIRDMPFLIFDVDFKIINHTFHTEHFYNHPFEEVTPEFILSLKVEKKPKWKDFGKVDGYYVSDKAMIREYHSNPLDTNMNVFPTQQEAEACIALSQLLQWRDKYNDGWKPDWTNDYEHKFVIKFYDEQIEFVNSFKNRYVLAFKSPEIRDKFLEDFQDLIEQAKPLL